jgi:hypothetical protein
VDDVAAEELDTGALFGLPSLSKELEELNEVIPANFGEETANFEPRTANFRTLRRQKGKNCLPDKQKR